MPSPIRRSLAACALALSCGALAPAQDSRPTSQPTSQPTSRPQFPELGHPAGVFGAGVTRDKGLRLREAAAKVDELHGQPVRVDGVIKDVCQKKGCWMVVQDGDQSVRVRFQGYSFFVPRDAAGREVLFEGTLTRQTISEEEAKHYAEESGEPGAAEKIKGPQQVLSFTATGVEILGARALPPAAEAKDPAQATALRARLKAGKPAGKGQAKPAGPAEALSLLRALKGPRVAEFDLYTELDGWLIFSRAGERPFHHGYAVRLENGQVTEF